ncbi:MAG: ABC transporter permease [Lachnospiraceae bacterium]|nr:ABC transporter permease [Lachnospiraceae bacterium]
MKTLKMEFYKIKRRKTGLTLGAMTAVQFLWCVWAFRGPDEYERLQGWLGTLYSMPLLNSIMMPTIMAVLASRLADIEHKGNTYKQLRTLRNAGTLFNAKVLCGLLFILMMYAAQLLFLILLGHSLHYEGRPDMGLYLRYLFLSIACTFALYLLQLTLSMLFFNQMIPLVTGLCGSMLGLILMYLYNWNLRSLFPWGGYIATMFVGADWNPQTRIMTYYLMETSENGLLSHGFIFLWAAVFYITGRWLFTRREA